MSAIIKSYRINSGMIIKTIQGLITKLLINLIAKIYLLINI